MREIADKSVWRLRAAEVTTFKYLSSAELDILLGKAAILSYQADEIIVKEDEISPWFFAILKLKLNTFKS